MIEELYSIGNLLAIATFILGVLITLALRSRTELRYHVEEVAIVGGGSPEFAGELEIYFNKMRVPRVTKTTVTIWNSGNTTLRKDGIAPRDPLRVSTGAKILKANLTQYTRAECGAGIPHVSPDGGIVTVGFDFLKNRDGLALEIIHDGEMKKTELLGTIIDSKDGPKFGDTTSFIKNLTDSDRTLVARFGIALNSFLNLFVVFWSTTFLIGIGVGAGMSFSSPEHLPPVFPEKLISEYPAIFYPWLAFFVLTVVWVHWRTFANAPAPMVMRGPQG